MLTLILVAVSCYPKAYHQQHKDKMFQGWKKEHKKIDQSLKGKVKGPKH